MNTGGGGGGTGHSQASGGGGSGVVVIRYPDSFTAASTTGSPTVNSLNGFRIYVFNALGSITF